VLPQAKFGTKFRQQVSIAQSVYFSFGLMIMVTEFVFVFLYITPERNKFPKTANNKQNPESHKPEL
jgi:hypothetical protein